MNLLKGMLIILVLLVVTATSAWSFSEGRLLNQSSSGQTALFNLGSYDGVVEGDFAVIVKEIRDLDSRDLRVVPVARAKNIKITTNNSVWVLYKIFDAELLVKGQKYLVLAESQMLAGRRDPRLARVNVVTDKKKINSQVKYNLADDADRLSKLRDQYPEVESMHTRESRTDEDITLVDVDVWEKRKDNKYRTAFYKSPHDLDFNRELRLSTFEKMVSAYLQKVNDPEFNYDKFYEEQKRTTFANEFRERSSIQTEYEEWRAMESRRSIKEAKLQRAVLEKGGTWSEDYSDEDLKTTLKEVSVLQEKDRRIYVASDPKRFSIFLGYGMPINDEQNDSDTAHRRDSRYSVEFHFEGTPLLKHETLERFTLFAGARINRSAFDAEGYNADINETSLTAGANWYPLYPPHEIEAPVIFVGTYISSGTAAVEAPGVGEKGNYTVLAMPAFWGGLKYNFKNKVGLRIALSMETLKLDRYEQSKFNPVLPSETSITEGKMNFALAYSF